MNSGLKSIAAHIKKWTFENVWEIQPPQATLCIRHSRIPCWKKNTFEYLWDMLKQSEFITYMHLNKSGPGQTFWEHFTTFLGWKPTLPFFQCLSHITLHIEKVQVTSGDKSWWEVVIAETTLCRGALVASGSFNIEFTSTIFVWSFSHVFTVSVINYFLRIPLLIKNPTPLGCVCLRRPND